MPYRRLPNTDKTRSSTMQNALAKGEIYDMFDLAFSQKLLNELQGFLPRFERDLYLYQQGITRQADANRTYQDKLQKARMYVSHYIQALNMAVMRGEIKPSEQTFLGLEKGAKTAPALNSEQSIIEWGNKVTEGDMRRISQGGKQIYTPSMANVKVHFERYKEAYNNQNFLKNNTARLLENLTKIRIEADDIILRIWNEVEAKFENIIDQEKRLDACREYGLIYYYRKGEKTDD